MPDIDFVRDDDTVWIEPILCTLVKATVREGDTLRTESVELTLIIFLDVLLETLPGGPVALTNVSVSDNLTDTLRTVKDDDIFVKAFDPLLTTL